MCRRPAAPSFAAMPSREPHRHHRIGRALTAGALVAAVAFPSASSAMPIIDPPARASAQSAPSAPGFQWDDAAIGAGSVLVLVGTGGALAGGARGGRMRRALASWRGGRLRPSMAGLLERSDSLSGLDELLAAVRSSGEGRLVLLGGEAGVGKTALLRAFCDAP